MRTVTLMLLLSLLTGPGCSSGGGNGGGDIVIPPGPNEVELRYDGDNLSAPTLAAATYEAAARFPTAKTAALAGAELTRVDFYVASAPVNCKVKIYGAGTASTPGLPLYSHDVTAGLVPGILNSHVLISPVTVPNGDLWIAIEFTNAISQATIGCDPGPALPNGDWLYSSTDSSWIPLVTRFPAVSINWNIRGIVTVPA